MLLTFLIVVFAIPYVICMGAYYLIRELVSAIRNRRMSRYL